MIQLRSNGKFFTLPICAASAELAFESMKEGLAAMGRPVKVQGFTRKLRPAGTPAMQFMWEHALAAEANDVKVVFCLFDHAGWRFFGRV